MSGECVAAQGMRPALEQMHPTKRRNLAQRLRDRIERTLDYRLVRWTRLGDAQQAWYLRRLVALLDIDLVIDVGGNLGQFASLLRERVHYSGALITVEPIPEMGAALRQRFAGDTRWALEACALGEKPGRAILNVMQGHELSSLLPPSNVATDSLDRFNQIRQQVEVEVSTLDRLLELHPLARDARNIYLKLDVQGYELQVLRGAQDSLPRIAALQAEASVIPLYEGVPPYHALMREIDAMGFQLSFIPAHNYTQVPDMVDFDCHFVSRGRMIAKGYLRDAQPDSGTSLS